MKKNADWSFEKDRSELLPGTLIFPAGDQRRSTIHRYSSAADLVI